MTAQVRSIVPTITNDLTRKMVFLAGPRQVGKTTAAKQVLSQTQGVYLNWDLWDDRRVIEKAQWPSESRLVVLDELHKFTRWKNFLKGRYDTKPDHLSILVTGSARLDVYRRGGDSLLGRYFLHRLHPLTVAELSGPPHLPEPFKPLSWEGKPADSLLDQLLRYGGFPEPFFSQNEDTWRRWHNGRYERIVREDIRDLTVVRDLSGMETLITLLATRIGSLLSIQSLREEMQAAHTTLSHWVEILERMYVFYRIAPWHGRLERALKREPKVYAWDWTSAAEGGARLENLVAGHLHKLCDALQDRRGFKARLWFVRDREKRECDFLVTVDGKPWFLAEVKSGGARNTPIRYFKDRLKVPYAYVASQGADRVTEDAGVVTVPMGRFLNGLGA